MDDLTDQELYDELIASLAFEGVRATPGPHRSTVLLHNGWTWSEGETPERFDPPLELHVNPWTLGRHLRDMASDAQEAFGGPSPLGDAMSLFLVHVMETVETRPGRRHLTLSPSGVDASHRPPS
ncbi:hypothetical protein KIK06_06100 [Nocardiopsis sp. EMB25]|uniref:hypothetical protein n=1 Tax=Nocardiopsis sp. EMB25 TaxID=2835867 RepID=UPI002285076F|nr:hypothetical protein [Nocardiopsis sp. EMB25]MCY9783466.1 hypothetical protein [Nocardiopsis sp. EMB25]